MTQVKNARGVVLHGGVKLSLNFFQSCHGKGMRDSENHSAKPALRTRERGGMYLGGAASLDAAEFLKEHLTWPSKIDEKTGKMRPGHAKKMNTIRKRIIKYYGLGYVKRSEQIRSTTAPKLSTEHYAFCCPTGIRGELQYGWLSCSCINCMLDKPGACSVKELVNFRNLRRGNMHKCQGRLKVNMKILAQAEAMPRPRVARRDNMLKRLKKGKSLQENCKSMWMRWLFLPLMNYLSTFLELGTYTRWGLRIWP